MSIRNLLLLIIFSCFLSSNLNAQQVTQDEVDNLMIEKIVKRYVECASYFTTLTLTKTQYLYYSDNMLNMKNARRQSLHFALIATKYGTNHQKEEILFGKLKNQHAKMLQQIGPNFQNLEALVLKYDDLCQIAIREPGRLIKIQQQELINYYTSL